MARAPEAGPICMRGPLLGPARISAPGPRGTGLPQGGPLQLGRQQGTGRSLLPVPGLKAPHPTQCTPGAWMLGGPARVPPPRRPARAPRALSSWVSSFPSPTSCGARKGRGKAWKSRPGAGVLKTIVQEPLSKGSSGLSPWVGAVLGPLPDPKKPGAGGPLPFPGAAACLVCQPGRTDRAGEEGADCWAPPSRPFSSPPTRFGFCTR